MKRDILIAILAILLIAGISYGLSTMRPDVQLTPSHPFSAMSSGPAAGDDKVIMHINGEPVTEREFAVFTASLPPQAQSYLGTADGKKLIAEQYVRMKVLEQEGRRLGAESDPEVAAKMKFGKLNVGVEYALKKLSTGDEKSLRAEYEKTRGSLDSVDLSHIVLGFQGSAIPSRRQPVPTREQAVGGAREIIAKLREGAPFDQVAAAVSDDTQSAQAGGRLGLVPLAQLPPELQAPIAKLKPNEISEPVVSQFGVHIFRVAARRTQTFEEAKAEIQQRTQQGVVRGAVDRLQKAAKVEYDPKFFPPTSRAPGVNNPGRS
jgi:hypothetical protein